MKNFRVRWEIDIDAEHAGEAAVKAQQIMRDFENENIANVFEVVEHEPSSHDPNWDKSVTVDLDEAPDEMCICGAKTSSECLERCDKLSAALQKGFKQ